MSVAEKTAESKTFTKVIKDYNMDKFKIDHKDPKLLKMTREFPVQIDVENLEDECPPTEIEFLMGEPKWTQTWETETGDEQECLADDQPTSENLEHPTEKMMRIQTLSIKVKDELDTLKDALRLQGEVEQKSNAAKDALQRELLELRQDNLLLNRQLEKEREACGLLRNMTTRLSATLETETKAVEALSREKQSLSKELQKEYNLRMQLNHELLEYKEAMRRRYQTDRSCTELEARKIESLSKEKELLTLELQKERSWKLQLGDELQEYKEAFLRRFQTENCNPDSEPGDHQMSESLQSEVTRVSSRLETETTKIESWSKEKESLQEASWKMPPSSDLKGFHNEGSAKENSLCQVLESLRNEVTRLAVVLEKEVKNKSQSHRGEHDMSAALQQEQIQMMQPKVQASHQNVRHLQKLKESRQGGDAMEVQNEKVKNLKISNFLLNHQLSVQRDICANLEAENGRLSNRLEKEIQNNNSLEKLRESDAAQLQQEKRWRLELQNQLQKQMYAHQKELEALKQSCVDFQALHHDLEHLKTTNAELSTKLQNEEDLCRHFHVLTQRLTSYLQTERRKNKCLSNALQKEMTRKQHLTENIQGDKDVHRQVLEALKNLKVTNSGEEVGKRSRNVFGWRKKNKQKQEESTGSCCEHICGDSSQRVTEVETSTTQE